MPDNWGLKLVVYVPVVIALMLGVAYCSNIQSMQSPAETKEEGTSRAEPPGDSEGAKNTHIVDNLNAADILFKQGDDGCPSVSLAILAANSPSIFGPSTSSQRQELKSYAQRCNLRF